MSYCLNHPNFCSCDCHKPGWLAKPPYCFCRYRDNMILPYKLPAETLQLCQHGAPVKWPCSLCANEEQKVSEPIVKWEDYQYLLKEKQILEERIGKLEQNTQTQYEHNCDGIEKLFERVEKLEKDFKKISTPDGYFNYQFNLICSTSKEFMALGERIEKIEKSINDLELKYVIKNSHYNGEDLVHEKIELMDKKIECLREDLSPLHEAHNEIHLTIDKSIRRLEKTLQALVDKDINSDLTTKDTKKLFICDECMGHGTVILTLVEKEILVGNPVNAFCKKCEGTGVVWG